MVAGLRKQFEASEKKEGIPALWRAFGRKLMKLKTRLQMPVMV